MRFDSRQMAWVAVLVLAWSCDPRPALEDTAGPEVLSAAAVLGENSDAGFERALERREFQFPRDHGPHESFQTEWWYFTGNLEDPTGRRFGYQLTFFRRALAPEMEARGSAWASRQVYMAHFALSDIDGESFTAHERFSRGGAALAGATAEPFRVWLDDWQVLETGDGWLLQAEADQLSLRLQMQQAKPTVFHGDGGLSAKGREPGNASYYYTLPRLESQGELRLGEQSFPIEGLSWLDREWSTSVLEQGQVGWDWLSLQLDDGRDLMFYRLRKADGTTSFSSGTLIGVDGTSRSLTANEVEWQILETWQSPRGGTYPAAWRLGLPAEQIDVEILPLLADQELDVSFRYWEGAVAASGTGETGEPLGGRGYVELVGYGSIGN